MKIIDAHTHIYPDKIAAKATQSIGEFYNLPMRCVGSVEELLRLGSEVGVEKFIVHSVAVAPGKVSGINNFVADEVKKHKEFVGFMTMHPALPPEDIDNEITRSMKMGLKGIKMHPDIQQFYIDGDDAIKIYEINAGRVPVLLHTGDDRYEFSAPARLAKVAKMFPKTTFIGAHFGGYSRWTEVDCYIDTPNVFFDTSSTLFKLPKEDAVKIIRKLGHHRFFFGTDFPIISQKNELDYFMALDLTDREREDILYNNAVAALGVF